MEPAVKSFDDFILGSFPPTTTALPSHFEARAVNAMWNETGFANHGFILTDTFTTGTTVNDIKDSNAVPMEEPCTSGGGDPPASTPDGLRAGITIEGSAVFSPGLHEPYFPDGTNNGVFREQFSRLVAETELQQYRLPPLHQRQQYRVKQQHPQQHAHHQHEIPHQAWSLEDAVLVTSSLPLPVPFCPPGCTCLICSLPENPQACYDATHVAGDPLVTSEVSWAADTPAHAQASLSAGISQDVGNCYCENIHYSVGQNLRAVFPSSQLFSGGSQPCQWQAQSSLGDNSSDGQASGGSSRSSESQQQPRHQGMHERRCSDMSDTPCSAQGGESRAQVETHYGHNSSRQQQQQQERQPVAQQQGSPGWCASPSEGVGEWVSSLWSDEERKDPLAPPDRKEPSMLRFVPGSRERRGPAPTGRQSGAGGGCPVRGSERGSGRAPVTGDSREGGRRRVQQHIVSGSGLQESVGRGEGGSGEVTSQADAVAAAAAAGRSKERTKKLLSELTGALDASKMAGRVRSREGQELGRKTTAAATGPAAAGGGSLTSRLATIVGEKTGTLGLMQVHGLGSKRAGRDQDARAAPQQAGGRQMVTAAATVARAGASKRKEVPESAGHGGMVLPLVLRPQQKGTAAGAINSDLPLVLHLSVQSRRKGGAEAGRTGEQERGDRRVVGSRTSTTPGLLLSEWQGREKLPVPRCVGPELPLIDLSVPEDVGWGEAMPRQKLKLMGGERGGGGECEERWRDLHGLSEENVDLRLRKRLLTAAEALATHDEDVFSLYMRLLEADSSPFGSPTQRVAHYITKALRGRARGTALVQQFDRQKITPQTARAVVNFACATPYTEFWSRGLNYPILSALQGHPVVHIVDFGLWRRQWVAVLKHLAKHAPELPHAPPVVACGYSSTPATCDCHNNSGGGSSSSSSSLKSAPSATSSSFWGHSSGNSSSSSSGEAMPHACGCQPLVSAPVGREPVTSSTVKPPSDWVPGLEFPPCAATAAAAFQPRVMVVGEEQPAVPPARRRKLLHVRFTAVEMPPGVAVAIGPSQSARQLHTELALIAAELDISLEFQSLCMRLEDFTAAQVQRREGERLAVCCCRQMDTILDDGTSKGGVRDRFLKEVAYLQPAVVTMADAVLNTNMPFFLRRFSNSLHYNLSLFSSFDPCDARDSPARQLFEAIVCARPILNAVGCDGTKFVLRSEPLSRWHWRMLRAGLQPASYPSWALTDLNRMLQRFPRGFSVQHVDASEDMQGGDQRMHNAPGGTAVGLPELHNSRIACGVALTFDGVPIARTAAWCPICPDDADFK